MPPRRSYEQRQAYPLRIMACLAGSLALLIGVFVFWPPPSPDAPGDEPYSVRAQEVIAIEEIAPTRQQQRRPPPPAPLPPVAVPDDRIFEEQPLTLDDTFFPIDEPGEDELFVEGTEGNQTSTQAVEIGPKPVRFVEPEYTREARRKRIRAEVVVEVLVDERGRVQQTQILERYLLGEEGTAREAVGALGFGLEEAALAAAERWLFRPARKNGEPVQSFTTLTFSFGV